MSGLTFSSHIYGTPLNEWANVLITYDTPLNEWAKVLITYGRPTPLNEWANVLITYELLLRQEPVVIMQRGFWDWYDLLLKTHVKTFKMALGLPSANNKLCRHLSLVSRRRIDPSPSHILTKIPHKRTLVPEWPSEGVFLWVGAMSCDPEWPSDSK